MRLIERNMRRQWLTEAGQDLLQRCRPLLNDAKADDGVRDRTLSPKRMLRVTSSLSFAMIYMAPILPAFRKLYPKLDVQIIAANRYPDFIEAESPSGEGRLVGLVQLARSSPYGQPKASTQLGKLDVLKDIQSVSCKTSANSPQSHQYLTQCSQKPSADRPARRRNSPDRGERWRPRSVRHA